MGRVDGRTAVVTGASGGIGRVVCDFLQREGARVAGLDVSSPDGDSAVDLYRTVDVTDESSVAKAFGKISETFGGVDILVNTAGVTGPSKPPHAVTQPEFDQVFAVNVRGTWLCVKYAVPSMISGGHGSIINFSSIAGLVGGTALSSYHATKGAVRAMSRADAVTYASSGIRVNSIYPGSIATPMSDLTAEIAPEGAEAYRRRMTDAHPLGRRGTPEDIAYGVLYLASDESKFVTGAELVIDGGYTAR